MPTSSPTRTSLAKDLHALALAAWQKWNSESDEVLNMFGGTEAAAEARRIGQAANDLGGFASMQAVAHAAFCTRVDDQLFFGISYAAKDEMCAAACSQLNFAWSGIGAWQA